MESGAVINVAAVPVMIAVLMTPQPDFIRYIIPKTAPKDIKNEISLIDKGDTSKNKPFKSKT